MQRIFRKLTQKTVEEGGLRRYLIYALGEILLVMIGILLALQVNNLNARAKERREEQQILKTLFTEFKENIFELNRVMVSHDSTLAHIDYVLKKYDLLNGVSGDKESIKEIRNAVFGKTYDAKFGVLNSVLNTDKINLIRNDSLRNSLARIPGSLEDYSEDEKLTVKSIYEFYLPELFKMDPAGNQIKNYFVHNFLEFLIPIIEDINSEGDRLKKEMGRISGLIDSEIR